MSKKIIAVLLFLATFSLTMAAQEPDKAAAQLTATPRHFHGGDEVSFTMTLNEPLPEGARFDVRLSPAGVNQELSVVSGEPDDKDRKKFLLSFRLPQHARGGEWHIYTVWLFLPGASWVGSTLSTNEMTFVVDGPSAPLPSNATAALVKK